MAINTANIAASQQLHKFSQDLMMRNSVPINPPLPSGAPSSAGLSREARV